MKTSVRLKYLDFQVKLEVKKALTKFKFSNFLWFQKRSWRNLFGKETIIQSRNVKSIGGFEYLEIDISSIPLSENNKIN